MIFGNANLSLVPPEYYDAYYKDVVYEESTLGEVVANYLLGVLMVLSFLVSTALNPVVFYYNYQQVTGTVKLSSRH